MNVAMKLAPEGNLQARVETYLLLAMAVAIAAVMFAGMAHAGTDTTFSAITTTFTNWLMGSGGKAVAIISLMIAVVLAITTQSLMAVMVPVGVALTASIGPTVLSGLVTATL